MATLVSTSYQGTPGLGTASFVQIRNPATGAVLVSRSHTGVREDVASSGFYVWNGTISTDLPAYEAIWDEGGSTYAGEVVVPQAPANTTGSVILSSVSAGNSTNPLSFTIKRNDTDPSIIVQCLQPDPVVVGNVIPFPIPSGATVKFTMRDLADFQSRTRTAFTGAPKVHADATVTDAPNGVVNYGWIEADTNTDGAFRAEFEVTTLGGEIRTFPSGATDATNYIAVTITDDLDPGIDP